MIFLLIFNNFFVFFQLFLFWGRRLSASYFHDFCQFYLFFKFTVIFRNLVYFEVCITKLFVDGMEERGGGCEKVVV